MRQIIPNSVRAPVAVTIPAPLPALQQWMVRDHRRITNIARQTLEIHTVRACPCMQCLNVQPPGQQLRPRELQAYQFVYGWDATRRIGLTRRFPSQRSAVCME